MFSFGTIKYSTALGGAILRVRDGEVLGGCGLPRKPIRCSRWPVFKRLAKYAMLKGLAARPICASFVYVCRAIGCDYDRMVRTPRPAAFRATTSSLKSDTGRRHRCWRCWNVA